jgi:hypothetical protein
MTRAGEDFEWVNSWAEVSGLNAARQFAAQPAKAAPPPRAAPLTGPAARSAATYPVASGQLARDLAEIETARDAIIAAEGTGVFVLPGPQRRKPILGILRRHDVVPVLIGATLALVVLIVYGAIASIRALGR